MSQWLVTAALAVFAFLTALHGVSDHKSVYPPDESLPTSWYRRITRWGYVKVALILATFVFGCLNGYLTWSSSNDARSKQDAQQQTINDQNAKLADAQSLLASVNTKLAAAARAIDLAEKAVRNTRVFEGQYQAAMFPMSGIEYDLIDHQGRKYQPLREDRIEYNLVCRGGPAPDLTSCPQRAYGHLLANDDKVPVVQLSGSYVFQGTRSTGGYMTFEATTDCTPIRQQLEASMCEVNLDVTRLGARLELEQMRKDGFAFDTGLTDSAHDDLCRAYDILYGAKCDRIPESVK
jgi:hypothetical protein